MVCSDGFVWVVDGFIVLNLWWVVDGFVVESDGFVVVIQGPSRINHWFVIWGQWVCDLGGGGWLDKLLVIGRWWW